MISSQEKMELQRLFINGVLDNWEFPICNHVLVTQIVLLNTYSLLCSSSLKQDVERLGAPLRLEDVSCHSS